MSIQSLLPYPRKRNPHNGYVIYEDSIRVAIATGFKRKSTNGKTGPMIQVWILVKAENPLAAAKSGANEAICGKCPALKFCYVDLGKAPLQVWKTWLNGGYPVLTNFAVFYGHTVRFGAYGDPAFIPLSIIERILYWANGHTGYTHQWANPLFANYKRFLMASVESDATYDQAQALGWRTFRVTKTGRLSPKQNELVCLNTTRGISCHDCRLCNGGDTRKKSIVIEVHGAKKNRLAA